MFQSSGIFSSALCYSLAVIIISQADVPRAWQPSLSISQYRVYTKNGAVSIVKTIETAPLFCV
jgi:hypothetical protein